MNHLINQLRDGYNTVVIKETHHQATDLLNAIMNGTDDKLEFSKVRMQLFHPSTGAFLWVWRSSYRPMNWYAPVEHVELDFDPVKWDNDFRFWDDWAKTKLGRNDG